MSQKTLKVRQKRAEGCQKWAQGYQKGAKGSQKGAQGSPKGAQGSQKGGQGTQNGAQGSRKGAQREAKIDADAPKGVPRRRVRGPLRFPEVVWSHFGDIFDEKNDKKAMRSYTVFKYPKIDDFSMQKQFWN